MGEEELQILRIKEILEVLQEYCEFTIDYGKFKRIYPDTAIEDDK